MHLHEDIEIVHTGLGGKDRGIRRLTFALVICAGIALATVTVWGGALHGVPPGGDVFIGEEHLNLTRVPSGTGLSWYDGPQAVGRSAPAATIIVANAKDFYVSPSDFDNSNHG
ncbi:MAG TPA: DUF3821 domain-containing protein [Methanoregulaceae archaeon]|nr:DUF3821 domain-containing protein [Methanoregulaceae archaeon]